MSGVIPSLRAATRSAHDELSAELDPEVLCATREGYGRFLGALYGFHAAVEPELGRLELPGIEPVPARSALLASDLRALGIDAAALPLMPQLPDLHEDGARHGLLYVVEGSALGGLLLAEIVHRRLGFGPVDGAAFFAAGTLAVGRWRQIKASLATEADGARLAAAERAAGRTFELLRGWMRAQGVVGSAA